MLQTGNESQDLVASASYIPEELESGQDSGADLSQVVMGSTDSGGNAAGGQSCGLVSSLFPSSCRGRAEAFARRLHHRLTSLGGDDDERKNTAVPTPSETSWLHSGGPTASRNQVLERQPRHNSDSDLYFDFDIDDEDVPGSPVEEVTPAELAGLLLNPEALESHHKDPCHCPLAARPIANHQGPESGCIFSSPVTGTSPESDSSEIYYDPESSEGEKLTDSFYDLDTSESDGSSLSNGLIVKVLAHRHGSPRPEQSPKSGRKTVFYDGESSESCSESNNTKINDFPVPSHRPEHVDHSPDDKDALVKDNDVIKRAPSSEDSLNGKSSLDTTSPSHESLWSTFDDSTISLQDETPVRPLDSLTVALGHVHKSHSDSEIPVNRSHLADVVPNSVQEVDEVDLLPQAPENCEECSTDSKNQTDKSDIPVRAENARDKLNNGSRRLRHDISIYHHRCPKGSDNSEGIMRNNLQLPSNDDVQIDTDTDHSTYSSTINIPGALTLECPSGARVSLLDVVKNEVQLEIKDGAVVNGGVDKMAELLKRLGGNDTTEDDEGDDDIEEEEEQQRPQRVRRCSSLKTGKTPPGTPGRKKIVRFADALGLDLADVRTFLDEIPKVPNSAYSDLIYDDSALKDSPTQQSWRARYLEAQLSSNPARQKGEKLLVPLFQQPGGLPDFLDKVKERQVCLENVLVQDPVSLCLSGTVRVRNLDFHKSVHIRYSINGWQSYSDLQATYVNNSCDGFSDKFIFTLYCHTLNAGQRIEFAVRYQCKGSQYWDNNGGANYCFQCLPAVPSVSYIPITTTVNEPRDWAEPAFY